jgi:hypothetical protein
MEALFFDGEDYEGMFFWFNDLMEIKKDMDNKTKGKK